MSAKMGRPSTDPKSVRISVRLNDECANVLKEYCEKNGVTVSEAVSEGVRRLKTDIKK